MAFGVSPKMSTYLLAWAVGEFDYLSGTTQVRCVSVCARPCKQAWTHAPSLYLIPHAPSQPPLQGGVTLRVFSPPGRAGKWAYVPPPI